MAYVTKARSDVARQILAGHGRPPAHIFRLSANATLLTMIYRSDAKGTNAQIAKEMLSDGKQSGLPEELWRPIADAALAGATPEAFRAALEKVGPKVISYFRALSGGGSAAATK
jgi:hypothetical protein